MPILDEVRITELPGADPLAGPELIPLVQSGVTKSRSAQNLVLDGGLQEHLDAANPHNQYAFRVLNNLTSNTDPTVNNDSSEGYSVLSKWLNSATTEVWLCLDATVGAAIWDIKTLNTDDLGSAALANVGAGNGLDADLLDSLNSSQFVRSDTSDTLDGSYTVTGNLTVNGVANIYGNFINFITGTDARIEVDDNNVDGTGVLFTFWGDGESGNAKLKAEVYEGDKIKTLATDYQNAARNEGVTVEYNESSKSLEYNFF